MFYFGVLIINVLDIAIVGTSQKELNGQMSKVKTLGYDMVIRRT